jgi:hypothetical protein
MRVASILTPFVRSFKVVDKLLSRCFGFFNMWSKVTSNLTFILVKNCLGTIQQTSNQALKLRSCLLVKKAIKNMFIRACCQNLLEIPANKSRLLQWLKNQMSLDAHLVFVHVGLIVRFAQRLMRLLLESAFTPCYTHPKSNSCYAKFSLRKWIYYVELASKGAYILGACTCAYFWHTAGQGTGQEGAPSRNKHTHSPRVSSKWFYLLHMWLGRQEVHLKG